MAWGDISVLMSLPGPGLGGPPVQFTGTPEQKERFFGVFKQPGLHWGAYGLTEPGAGSDVAGIRTTLPQGRQALGPQRAQVLHHQRRARRLGGHLRHRRSDAGARRSSRLRGREGHARLLVGKIEDKMGLRASETAELVLEDCRVPEENLLGGEAHYERGKEGFMAAMKTFDTSRPMVGALGVGIARAAYEYARDFVKENYVLARPIPRYAQLADTLADGQAAARCGAPHVLARGLDGRRRAAEREGGVDGQGLRRPGGDEGLPRRGPDHGRARPRAAASSSRSGIATSRSSTSSRAPGRSSAS